MAFLKYAGILVIGAVIGLLAAPHAQPSFGGVYSISAQHFGAGLYAGKGDELRIDTNGRVHSNASTFCLDFFATSTATRVHMTASSTATIEGTDGVMVTAYGACP